MTLDMRSYYAGKGAEKITHTLDARQTWRQVGWLGLANHGVFALDDAEGCKSDPAGYQPIWILVENELPLGPSDVPEQP